MNAARRIRYAVITVVGAGSLALTGCSSSGGGGTPSQQQIVTKLKSDPEVKTAFAAKLGNNPTALNALYVCMANAMRKDANAGDVTDYVNGKTSIDKVGQTTSDTKIKSDIASCAAAKIVQSGSAPSSVPSS